MDKDKVNQFFLECWNSNDELQVPTEIDAKTRALLLDKFKENHNAEASKKLISTSSSYMLFAIAASLLIVFVSWGLLNTGNQLTPENVLVEVIMKSQQLEQQYHHNRINQLNEHAYVKRLQLEREIVILNDKLADAYFNEEKTEHKIQLWSQKNQMLTKLNALMLSPDNTKAAHI